MVFGERKSDIFWVVSFSIIAFAILLCVMSGCANLSKNTKIEGKDNKVSQDTTLVKADVKKIEARVAGMEQRIGRMNVTNNGIGWKEILASSIGISILMSALVYTLGHNVTKSKTY